jgi:hypothetical protein
MKNSGTKIIAKILAAHGYRNNTPIENIHAGRWPKTKHAPWYKMVRKELRASLPS